MNRDVALETAWPTMIGAMIGVEVMLSALLVWGPAKLSSEVVASLTQGIASEVRPEYDLQIYAIGCVIACCLVVGLEWIQRRRLSCLRRAPAGSAVQSPPVDCRDVSSLHTQTGQKDWSVQRRWSQIVLCAMLFLVHLVVVLAIQRLFVLTLREVPLSAALILFVQPASSLCIVILGWRLARPKVPEWIVSRPDTTPPSPRALSRRWVDVTIALGVIGIIYIPEYSNVAGTLFLSERLHHWDFYAMGPTLALQHGRALGTEFYTQYGVGWPLLYRALSPVMPISYGHMIQVSVMYGCVYSIGIYVLLGCVLESRIWAVMGLCCALALQLFSGTDSVLWGYPSSTVIRSPVDVWFFICILFHARTGRALWLRLAAALSGAAILFGTDTGIYVSAAFLAYWHYLQSLPRVPGNRIGRQMSLALQCGGIALAVAMPVLWIAGRGTLCEREFWAGWLESLVVYGGGVMALPIASVPPLALLLFTLVVVLYLSTIGVTLVKWPRRDNAPENVFLACLSTYGLATLLLFVGRSHPFNIMHVSVPFSIVAVVTLARWCKASEPPEYMEPRLAKMEIRQALEQHVPWPKALPWAALIIAVTLLVTDRHFQEYPGILQSSLSAAPPAGFCLLKESEDVCGLPADAQEYGKMFEAVVGRMREAVASGGTVAVLDDADPIFYLAAKAAPWSRYSPIGPALLTRASVAQLMRQLAEGGPEVVVIRSSPDYILFPGSADVWREIHESVAGHYRLDSTVGVFEFWRRNTT